SCIDGAHVDDALDSEQGARGRAGHTVLPRTGLRDDAPLAHALGEHCLTDGAVDLVRAGMREVFSFEEHAGETYRAGKTRGIGERRRPAHPVAQDPSEVGLKSRVGPRLEPRRLELRDRRHERLGEILATELAVSTRLRLRDHTLTVRLIEAMPWMSGPGSSARMRAVPTRTASTRAGSIRASSTEAMPDSATRSWVGNTNECSCRIRPLSMTPGLRRLRALTPIKRAPDATARPKATGSWASTSASIPRCLAI